MISVIPPGDPTRTVIAGKAQGYLGLAVNYGQCEDANHPGVIFPTMTTAWQPTPEKLALINAGNPIIVQILGTPPIRPMLLYVEQMKD